MLKYEDRILLSDSKEWLPKDTLISIIIPVYNVEKYIAQCVMSIISDPICREGRVEVIIIDDGSSDASGAIADSFASEYSYITVIHQKNSGVAAARNVGIQKACGKWLYFMDSDDWLVEDAVTVLCEKCQKYKDADILLFDAYQNTKSKQYRWEHFSREYTWMSNNKIHCLQRGVLYFPIISREIENTKIPLAAPWDKLYRMELVKNSNVRFRENLLVLDDMVFNFEIIGEAEKIVYLKQNIYHYRYVNNSITNNYKKNRVELDKDVWQYIEYYMEERVNSGKWSMEERVKFAQAFYCRIVKSFGICCRLQFFNSANGQNIQKKIKSVKSLLGTSPYKKAFHGVKLVNLEWKLKILVLVGRYRIGIGVYLLNFAENMLKKYRLFE